jgi:hypothetical protein
MDSIPSNTRDDGDPKEDGRQTKEDAGRNHLFGRTKAANLDITKRLERDIPNV